MGEMSRVCVEDKEWEQGEAERMDAMREKKEKKSAERKGPYWAPNVSSRISNR